MPQAADIILQDEKHLGCLAEEIIAQLPDSLSRGILQWAEESPDSVALVTPARSYTYSDLVKAVQESITFLKRRGIRKNDRLMLVCENGASAIILFLALSEINAIAVIVNARLSEREVELIFEDCEPRCAIYTVTDSVAATSHVLARSCEAVDMTYGCLMVSEDTGVSISASTSEDNPEKQILAMIYTTGTTGAPKGVMLTQRNLTFMAYVSGKLRLLSPEDQIYCVLPLSHVFGLSAVCCSVLFAGATLHIVPRFDAKEVLRALSNDGITGFLGVPTMYALMLEVLPEHWRPSKLRFLYAGGAPLDPNLKSRVESHFGLVLHNGYGLTETGPTICQTRLYAPQDDCSVGYPLPGLDIEIRGEKNELLPTDSTGELWVRGPNVMLGYYKKPILTDEVLIDGWFNTGDLVYKNGDGVICIAGRTKELIIRSGFNVYPPEIEAILSDFPGVSVCAVVGREREGDEEILAFIQPGPSQKVDPDALLKFARTKLTAYKVPTKIITLEALPASPSGKILKHRLLEILVE